MSDVLAVLLCRLFMTCAGVAVGIPDKGACSTAVAVALFVSLLVSLSLPVCQPPPPTVPSATPCYLQPQILMLLSTPPETTIGATGCACMQVTKCGCAPSIVRTQRPVCTRKQAQLSRAAASRANRCLSPHLQIERSNRAVLRTAVRKLPTRMERHG